MASRVEGSRAGRRTLRRWAATLHHEQQVMTRWWFTRGWRASSFAPAASLKMT